jgi:hypothetical protein
MIFTGIANQLKMLTIMNTLEPYQQIYTYDTGNNLTNLSHHHLVISLNLVLAELRLGLKNRQVK